MFAVSRGVRVPLRDPAPGAVRRRHRASRGVPPGAARAPAGTPRHPAPPGLELSTNPREVLQCPALSHLSLRIY